MKSKSAYANVQVRRFAVFAGVFCLALSAGVMAKEANKPCAEDAQKFCKGVEPGEGRIVKCMKQHENELSPACKGKIAEFKEEAKEFHEACREDVQKQCKDVKPGEGRIVQCLKAHQAQLSPACREKFEQAAEKRRK
ncbi:MAG TPA: cysteine rich repeat-containing protein [Gallionellaceae bacterium]